MPRIKDLGINIVPGTMRPLEVGGGGGAGCRFTMHGGGGPGGPRGQTSPAQCSLCDCLSGQCHPHSGCMPQSGIAQRMVGADDPTLDENCYPTNPVACSLCDCLSGVPQMVSPCDCRTNQPGPPCTAGSRTTPITAITDKLAPGSLSRDEINTLRGQLKQALDNLDTAEKNNLPKTIEECEAREKELQRELEALKARRNELKK
jgi:hypothetical protein